MANILIYSSNLQMINQCRSHLSSQHSIKVTDSFVGSDIADIVLIDSQLIDEMPSLPHQIRATSSLCLILGHHWTENKQIQSLLQGASGYLEQNELGHLLLKAIESIQKGEIWIHRKLVHQVIEQLTLESRQKKAISGNKLKLSKLSKREIDVATMIAAGQNNKQIASQLKITERTVKAHLTSIFKKLHISDRLHLALLVKESLS